MRHTIAICDALVLEAHPEDDSPHILLRREAEPSAERFYVSKARPLGFVMCAMLEHTIAVDACVS